MTAWAQALVGALSTAVVGTIALVTRRLMYGKSEDEALATKAAKQAVEVVDDVLKTLREQREADRDEIVKLRARIAELEHEVWQLKAALPRPPA